jgi:hypothetical protein
VLVACALLVRLAPVHDPKPFVVGLIGVSGLAVAVESAIAFWARDRRDARADELIAAGFVASGRGDQVSRALAERIEALGSARARARLAENLRWHVDLERDLVCARSPRVPAVRGFAPNADLASTWPRRSSAGGATPAPLCASTSCWSRRTPGAQAPSASVTRFGRSAP